MHNILSDNICDIRSKDTKSNSKLNNNTVHSSCPQSNTFVHNVNNFINLTEHSTLPGSTSEAFKSRRDIDEQIRVQDRHIRQEKNNPDFGKDKDKKNRLLLDLFYSQFKNQDETNSELLKNVKKNFEKKLAKLLAHAFVNNILKTLNIEIIFRKILNDFIKKKKITPIKDGGSNFELSEKGSEKESRSHNKTNICPHPDKPHYAKVKF